MDNVDRQSIKKIYSDYFDIIDSFFGSIKHYLGEEKDSHIDLGIYMASYPLISDLILDAIEGLDDEIEKFWSENLGKVFDYVKAQDTLKCVYSGDLSPVILEDFIKKSALYVDSIIIADPIYNLAICQKQIIWDGKYYLNKIVRHVFNVWKLKDLILSDSRENILFILPINLQLVNSVDKNSLRDNANNGIKDYINTLTGKGFVDGESALSFLESIKTTENILGEIKNHDILPNMFRSNKSLNSFLKSFSSVGNSSQFNDKSVGWNFGMYIQSQFIRVQEHRFFCDKLVAEPIYDYELPWFFFNYEMGCGGMDDAIINSLQKERFDWIAKVPISAIRVLRDENKLDYMRTLLRNSITDLKAKNDTDLLRVSDQVEKNFKDAFSRQNSEIKSLEKEVSNIVKKEIPITTGGLLVGFVPYLGNAVSVATAGRDIKDLIGRRTEIKNNLDNQKRGFINLLMKSYE